MGIFITCFVIVSCQKGGLLNNSSNESVNGKNPSTNVVLESNPTAPLPDCNTYCISTEDTYVEKTGSVSQQWGNASDPHSKTVSYIVYNTPTKFIVNVSYVRSNGNASNTVSATAFGTTKMVTTLNSGATTSFVFDLPSDWSKCDDVEFTIYQEGQNSPVNTTAHYSLYEVCPVILGCTTELTGEAIACGNEREANFYFTSKDALSNIKIQGGLTNFTGADAVVTVTGGNMTTSQSTPGGSSNRVITVEGSVDACETITINIKWNSTNSGGIITGNWSASAGGVTLGSAAGLSCGN